MKDPNFWKHKSWCYGSVLNCTDRPEKRSKFSNFPIIKANHIEENGQTALGVLNIHDRIEENNIGFKLLKKMGWKTYTGLGKNENGIVAPPEILYNKSTHGLGVVKKDKKLANLVHHCDICNTNVSEASWQSHLNGKKHRKHLETRTAIHCEVCSITLDVNTWESHVKGKKHTKKLLASKNQNLLLIQKQVVPSVITSPIEPKETIPIPAPSRTELKENPKNTLYVHPSVIRILQGNSKELC